MAFCAYHRAFASAAGTVVYTNEPYPDLGGCGLGQAPNGNEYADAAINSLSHEIIEAITDPTPPEGGAWFDGNGSEIADECSSSYGRPLGQVNPGDPLTSYNQVINGHFYYTQQEFSNARHSPGTFQGCVQRQAATTAALGQGGPGLAATAAPEAEPNDIFVDAVDNTLTSGTTTTVTVDVDDADGDPVTGDPIALTTASDKEGPANCGSLSRRLGTTDQDGHLEVTYTAPPDNISCQIIATEATTGQSGEVTISDGTFNASAPVLAAQLPAKVTPGGGTTTFSAVWINLSSEPIVNTRFDVVLSGDDTATTGLTASQVHLTYADETTGGQFRDVPLTDDTINDGEIDGYLPPLTGFTFPARHRRTTILKLALDAGVTTAGSPLNIELSFNQVNPASGFTNTFDSQDADLAVAPADRLACSLSGVVYGGGTRTAPPLGGATVTAAGATTRTATTGASGAYSLAVPCGRYVESVSFPGRKCHALSAFGPTRISIIAFPGHDTRISWFCRSG